jgi:hypothetical protein
MTLLVFPSYEINNTKKTIIISPHNEAIPLQMKHRNLTTDKTAYVEYFNEVIVI